MRLWKKFSLGRRVYSMGAIIYLLKRNVINSLKELKKKPLRLIFYIAIVGLMVVSLRFSIKGDIQVVNANIDIYRSIFLAIILVFLFVSLKAGIEKGNTLFRLSDVNFLFTVPISSQLV